MIRLLKSATVVFHFLVVLNGCASLTDNPSQEAKLDNNPPQAYASYSHAVIVNDTVGISGWASNDKDKDRLTYSWSFAEKPTNSRAIFDNSGAMAPTFIADQPGSYTLRLIVNDGWVDSQPHDITVTATVDRIGLPRNPGKPGKQTLVGIDEDKDGVRDDIQRHIYATYPADSQKNLRAVLTEMARYYQTIFWNQQYPDRSYGTAVSMSQQLECLMYLEDKDYYEISSILKAEVINTWDRMSAYQSYDNSMAGKIFSSSSQAEDDCAFELAEQDIR